MQWYDGLRETILPETIFNLLTDLKHAANQKYSWNLVVSLLSYWAHFAIETHSSGNSDKDMVKDMVGQGYGQEFG